MLLYGEAKYFDALTTVCVQQSVPISFPNRYTHLLRPDKRLNKAAFDGDTNAMYEVLRGDQYVLERIDQVPFMDTSCICRACRIC